MIPQGISLCCIVLTPLLPMYRFLISYNIFPFFLVLPQSESILLTCDYFKYQDHLASFLLVFFSENQVHQTFQIQKNLQNFDYPGPFSVFQSFLKSTAPNFTQVIQMSLENHKLQEFYYLDCKFILVSKVYAIMFTCLRAVLYYQLIST